MRTTSGDTRAGIKGASPRRRSTPTTLGARPAFKQAWRWLRPLAHRPAHVHRRAREFKLVVTAVRRKALRSRTSDKHHHRRRSHVTTTTHSSAATKPRAETRGVLLAPHPNHGLQQPISHDRSHLRTAKEPPPFVYVCTKTNSHRFRVYRTSPRRIHGSILVDWYRGGYGRQSQWVRSSGQKTS